MHSFAPSLSFLLSISTLILQVAFSSLPSANAATLSTFNHTTYPRDLGPAAHSLHRKRHADVIGAVHAQARSAGLRLNPGRRGAGAEFTYFKTGMGACGHFNVASDFIVALNKEEFDSGNHCGAVITITANGKSAQATIQDRCVGCGPNNLDFTEGLYRFFDPSMNGVIQGAWEYGSGAPPAPSKKPAPIPPTTSKVQPSSTKAHSTTSIKTTPSSSSTPTQTSASASASSAAVTSAPSITPTAVSPTVQPSTGNIANLFGTLLNVGGLVVNTLPSA